MRTPTQASAAAAKGVVTRNARIVREHQAKINHMQKQIAEGTLIVRQMTEEEREFWGPPAKPRKKHKRDL